MTRLLSFPVKFAVPLGFSAGAATSDLDLVFPLPSASEVGFAVGATTVDASEIFVGCPCEPTAVEAWECPAVEPSATGVAEASFLGVEVPLLVVGESFPEGFLSWVSDFKRIRSVCSKIVSVSKDSTRIMTACATKKYQLAAREFDKGPRKSQRTQNHGLMVAPSPPVSRYLSSEAVKMVPNELAMIDIRKDTIDSKWRSE